MPKYLVAELCLPGSTGRGAFAVAAAVSILIAFVTVSYQAIKAAVANPVKSLKSE